MYSEIILGNFHKFKQIYLPCQNLAHILETVLFLLLSFSLFLMHKHTHTEMLFIFKDALNPTIDLRKSIFACTFSKWRNKRSSFFFKRKQS